jgi:hypothetical protein
MAQMKVGRKDIWNFLSFYTTTYTSEVLQFSFNNKTRIQVDPSSFVLLVLGLNHNYGVLYSLEIFYSS